MSNTGPLFPKTEIATVVASRLREHLSETAPNSELLEFAERVLGRDRTAPPGRSDTLDPLWRAAAADALDQLWREAAAKGSLQVQSRRDSRGEYVQAVCDRTDGSVARLICTAATLDAALRAIANWGNRRYFRIERWIGGVWHPWEFETYANEIAAEEVVERLRKMYKGEFRFVAVEP